MKKFKLKIWQWVLGFICLGGIFYTFSDYLFLYCNDAYVEGNLVQVAPLVSGTVSEVVAKNNEYVHKGDLLLKIDPTPFNIAIQQAEASFTQASSQLQVLQLQVSAAKQSLVVAKTQLSIANVTLKRYENLIKEGVIAQQTLDDERVAQQTAYGSYLTAEANLAQSTQALAVQEAAIKNAQSAIDLAKYNLTLTTITASTDGYVNNLLLYRGSYVTANQPMFGLLDDRGLYVIANYKEGALSSLKPGQTVWIMVSSHLGHFYRGKVISFGRAVARDPSADNPALPYIQPTTDWITYPYRFPVTIAFDHLPSDAPVAKGADVRTWIFP